MISKLQYITQGESVEDHVALVEELAPHLVWIQLRIKDVSEIEYIEAAMVCREITKSYDCKLIINDNVVVALASDADGVHLGQNDMAIKDARKVLGNDIIIKVDENTNVDWETGYPKIDNSTFGGIKTLGLSLDPKSGSGESAVKTTITFPNVVNDLRLFLTDIDSKTGNWKDKVVISSDAGNPTIESVNTDPTFTVSGNTITSKENSESFADP